MRSSHHLAWWRIFILCLCCCVVVVNGIASPNNNNNNKEEEEEEEEEEDDEVPRCFHANAKGRRASNEDETLCATIEAPRELEEEGGERMVGIKQFLVAAVFDGHDGRFVSSQARKLVAESVEGRLFEKEEGRFKKKDEDYSAKRGMSTTGDEDNVEMEERRERRALEMALRDVHETIERKMTDGADPDSSAGDGLRVGGSTALVALISPDLSRASFAWVGDSRAYACESTRNEAKLITRDHTVKASLEEAERVRKMGGVVTGDRAEGILVTRALGDFESRGVGGAKAETRTVRFEEFAERWDEGGEKEESSSGRGLEYASNPRERAEEIRKRRREGSSGNGEKDSLSVSSSPSSSPIPKRKSRARRRIRGIVLVSDGVIEKAEDEGESGQFMNELCEILFGDVDTTTVRRRIKRRRSRLETTTIALKPVPNRMSALKDAKAKEHETSPEDDEAFNSNEQPPENDIFNSDLVELKVDGEVELEPDERVFPIEAWADIRSFGENIDMAKNARLTCEMAIAMGSKDNVAVAAIKFPDVAEEPIPLNSEEKEEIVYAKIETSRAENEEADANRLTVADRRRNDGRIFSIDPKPGAIIANAFRLNEIVALSNGPIKNYHDGVLLGNERDKREGRVGSDIVQKYIVGGEGYQSYSEAIEIPWNADLYEYGEYFDFDGSYFSSASGALPEGNSVGDCLLYTSPSPRDRG